MATHSLDAFVKALQGAVHHAQQVAASRHLAAVERLTELDAAGTRHAGRWTIRVPTAGLASAGHESLTFPLLELRRWVLPQVTGLSLEIGVKVETQRRRHPNGLRRVRLRIPKESSLEDPETHRLRITLTGPQPGDGEVWLDGIPFKQFDRGRAEAFAVHRRSLLQRMFDCFSTWAPFRGRGVFLALSEEECRSLRTVLPEAPR